jgi:hypothetical protein
MRTGTKNRRSSESPTNSPDAPQLRTPMSATALMANGVNRVLARRSKDGFVRGVVIR